MVWNIVGLFHIQCWIHHEVNVWENV